MHEKLKRCTPGQKSSLLYSGKKMEKLIINKERYGLETGSSSCYPPYPFEKDHRIANR